jgi:hypothetical protein
MVVLELYLDPKESNGLPRRYSKEEKRHSKKMQGSQAAPLCI